MKSKMIAVAVAGMLVGCGSGGGSVEFQSQKGEPLVQYGDYYAEFHRNGPSLVQYQDFYAEDDTKGDPEVRFQNAYAEHADKGEPAFNEVEELAICEREGLQDQETCQRALSLIETGISEAKGEFDKTHEAFQIQSKAIVGTAENAIKRQAKRDAAYPEVIEYLVNATLEEDTFENRYAAAGYAIATYYYVRGIPEGHSNTGNPGLCADKGYCGDQYLKYQWN